FLIAHALHHRRGVSSFSEPALSALRRYAWPGNVRELNHVVERAVLMSRASAIEPADLRLAAAAPGTAGERRPMTLDEVELDAIRAALSRHNGNVVSAADELGMSRSALYRRMEKFGL